MGHARKPLNLESIPATGVDRDAAIALIEMAGDIALVVDPCGVILDVTADGSENDAGYYSAHWVGRPGADLGVFLTTLRKHGVIRLMATSVRGEQGGTSETEISAAAAPSGSPQFVGFILRDVGRRVADGPQGARDLTVAVEQLTSLVGRVALRDLLRDTSDLVERHFIEAALELTEDNRTAAAEVLGLSRQSLYVKMRRHHSAHIASPHTRQVG